MVPSQTRYYSRYGRYLYLLGPVTEPTSEISRRLQQYMHPVRITCKQLLLQENIKKRTIAPADILNPQMFLPRPNPKKAFEILYGLRPTPVAPTSSYSNYFHPHRGTLSSM